MTTHFGVSVPFQMVCFDEPMVCPYLPGLQLDAVAVTAGGQYHLVAALGRKDRFWLGPDRATVQRRAMILLVGLQVGSGGRIDSFHGDLVRGWLMDSWDAVIEEVAAHIAGPALAALGGTDASA